MNDGWVYFEKKLILFFYIGFGTGLSIILFNHHNKKTKKQNFKQRYYGYNNWATRFLTFKNGDNYTEELKGKYVDICLENYSMMIEYYKSIGRKL